MFFFTSRYKEEISFLYNFNYSTSHLNYCSPPHTHSLRSDSYFADNNVGGAWELKKKWQSCIQLMICSLAPGNSSGRILWTASNTPGTLVGALQMNDFQHCTVLEMVYGSWWDILKVFFMLEYPHSELQFSEHVPIKKTLLPKCKDYAYSQLSSSNCTCHLIDIIGRLRASPTHPHPTN